MSEDPQPAEKRTRLSGLIFRSGRHGEVVFTRELVEDMLEQLQTRPIPMNVEHDPTVIPIGRVLGGRLRELEEDEVGLEAEMELFPSQHSALILPQRAFRDALAGLPPIGTEASELEVAVDSRSYSVADVERLRQLASEVGTAASTAPLARFSQLPDALLVISLGLPAAAAWWFVRGFFTKAGEAAGTKLGEELGNEAVAAYRRFKQHLREMVGQRRTPATSPPITMLTLDVPRPGGGLVRVEGSTRAHDATLDDFLDAGDQLLAIGSAIAALVADPGSLATLHFTFAAGGWRFEYGLDDAAELVLVAFLPDEQYDQAVEQLRQADEPDASPPG